MHYVTALAAAALCALGCSAWTSLAGKEKAALADATGLNRVIARIDGTVVRFHDLNYDPVQRYNFELHAMKVRLYREQKAVLQQYIDQMLLTQEAVKRNIPADELITAINHQAEIEANQFEADKETLFQEFVKKIQRDFPSLSKKAASVTSPDPMAMLTLPADGPGTPFTEAIKNKVVEMKKVSYVSDCKETFIQRLRDQSSVTILLERPTLYHLDLTPENGPCLGSTDAPITIQAFIDFQCPYCKTTIATLKELLAEHKETIRIVVRDFPLPAHPDAALAARAAACADDQGRYWDYQDLLFENQQELDVMSLRNYARQARLDTIRFDQCLEDDSRREAVEKDMTAAALAGISSTPSMIINGYYVSGSPSRKYLEEVITDIRKGLTPRVEDKPGNG